MPRLTEFATSQKTSGGSGGSSDPQLLGYISGISTYDYRSFDYSSAHGGSIAVWRRGSNELSLYTGVDSGSGGAYSAVGTTTTETDGKDSQGWWQCAMNQDHIYLGRPQAESNNAGRMDIYSYASSGIGARAIAEPNTGTGYLSTNNFGFAKIAVSAIADRMIVQDGYTGHRALYLANVSRISPQGTNIFTQTTTSTTRFTRGYVCVIDNGQYHSGQLRTFILLGGTPSGSSVLCSWFDVNLNSNLYNGSFTSAGNSAEVQRVQAGAWAGVNTVLHAGTGSNAGTQAYRTNTATGVTTQIYSDDALSSDGCIAIRPGTSDNSAVMISAGRVFVCSDTTVAWPFTLWTEVANLLDLIPGVTSTQGLCRSISTSTVIAMGTNSGRIHVFDIAGIIQNA